MTANSVRDAERDTVRCPSSPSDAILTYLRHALEDGDHTRRSGLPITMAVTTSARFDTTSVGRFDPYTDRCKAMFERVRQTHPEDPEDSLVVKRKRAVMPLFAIMESVRSRFVWKHCRTALLRLGLDEQETAHLASLSEPRPTTYRSVEQFWDIEIAPLIVLMSDISVFDHPVFGEYIRPMFFFALKFGGVHMQMRYSPNGTRYTAVTFAEWKALHFRTELALISTNLRVEIHIPRTEVARKLLGMCSNATNTAAPAA